MQGEMTTIPEALVNTLIGMGTVFTVLILISFIIYLLKYIPKLLGQTEKKAPEIPLNIPDIPVEETEKAPDVQDEFQIIAVIAAAVAMQMEEETGEPVQPDGLVIRSIKRRRFS